MKIDCYPHVLPAPVFERLGDLPTPNLRNPTLYDLDQRRRVMDAFPDYRQLLVPFPMQPLVGPLGGPVAAAEAIRAGNDGLAAAAAAEPERFPAFVCALPLADPDEAIEELGRCVRDLGAVGAQLETNVAGVPISDDRYAALFDGLADLGVPVWLHPVRGPGQADFGSEDRSRFGLWQALGWPYETSVVMARLVLGGLFDRHPDLAVIVHHGGAMIPHFCGRLGDVLTHLGAIGFDDELAAALERLRRPLDDYFRMFYADTVLFGAGHSVSCVVDYFGVDHVLFGTDMPFDPEQGPRFIRDTIANVEALALSDDEQRDVFSGNLARLLPDLR